MNSNKCLIRDFVELLNLECGISNLTINDVSGVNKDKEFFEPAKQVGMDTSKYKIVPPGYFACNFMHVGRDEVLPIALNCSNNNKIVSPAYTVFKIAENAPLLADYFLMMLKSSERDRYFWFHTDSSVRDGMSWDDFCDLELDVPNLTIQKKFVDIYKALKANQEDFERSFEDLKLVCDVSIDQLCKTLKPKKIGQLIEISEEQNTNLNYGIDAVRGISIEKKFIKTKADMTGVSLKPYYLVKPGSFAYVTVTSRNGEKISLAFNNSDETFICSSSYIVFSVKDSTKLCPGYLRIFLNRDEFNRYARFNSWGSARETFDWDEMCDVAIPIPELSVQKALSDLFDVYVRRKEINEKLKEQLKNICPILIRGSLSACNE